MRRVLVVSILEGSASPRPSESDRGPPLPATGPQTPKGYSEMTSNEQEDFLRSIEPLRPAIRLHCYRMLGSAHDGDDVVQETLLRAWRAKDSLSDPERLRPW